MADVQREAAGTGNGPSPAVANRGRARGAGSEDVIPRIEETAQKWMKEVSSWLGKGEEYLEQGRTWLDEHPVSRDMVENMAKKVNLNRAVEAAPEAMDRVRERAGRMRSEFRPAMRQRMDSVKEHPMDAVLLGSAAALVTTVIIMSRRR